MYRAQDSVFSPKPQRKGPGDPGSSLKELFMRPALSVSLPASFSRWSLCLTAPLTPVPRRDDGNSWPYASRQVESVLFWKVILSQFPASWSRWFLTALPLSFLSLKIRPKEQVSVNSAAFQGRRCAITELWTRALPLPPRHFYRSHFLQRPRETRAPHSVRANVLELAQVLWKTHPGFKRLLPPSHHSSSLDLLSLCQLPYASLQM